MNSKNLFDEVDTTIEEIEFYFYCRDYSIYKSTLIHSSRGSRYGPYTYPEVSFAIGEQRRRLYFQQDVRNIPITLVLYYVRFPRLKSVSHSQ